MGRKKGVAVGVALALPTRQEKAIYVAALLRNLRTIAEEDGQTLLAHLIALAQTEAGRLART